MTSHSSDHRQDRTGILVILDGFGINSSPKDNAVAQADAPTWQKLISDYPNTALEASESNVGLPKGFMGNSEVGHLNIGAGRIVYQDFSLISQAIEDGSFYKNSVFVQAMQELKTQRRGGALHLLGLVSDGGVHSHISHLMALIKMARDHGIEKIWIHAITDGRDTNPTSGSGFIAQLEAYCKDVGRGKIATVMGRYYAMDRDSRWDRTEKAFLAMVTPKKAPRFSNSVEYLNSSYQKEVSDEFILPAACEDFSGVGDGDMVLFFNFRADRARQLTRAFTQNEFQSFRREGLPTLTQFIRMTPYEEGSDLPTAFQKPKVPMTLAEVLSQKGMKQLRIAETEKYAHVTYFFNGGDEKIWDGEKRVLVPSPREVPTYDQKPEMSAVLVTDTLLKELQENKYQFVVVNFANPDMVGHTGNLRAAIKAVETVDGCLKRILDWVRGHDAFAVFTADHGNCEKMKDDQGRVLTSHTLLPVPFVLVDPSRKNIELRSSGKLCDIAPTLLALWGISQPKEMTGQSLLD